MDDSASNSQALVPTLDGHVERRPKNTPAGVLLMVLKWMARAVVLVVMVDVVRILVTSKTIEWGTVAHYLTFGAILAGALTTLELTVAGMAIGIGIGVVLALMRLSPSTVMNAAASAYLWFFRGTPLLVQIIFLYNLASFIQRITVGIPFGGPTFFSWNTNSLITVTSAAVLALGLNQGAYMCEIVRAGILSVDEGQMEASLALGMTRRRAMRRIILPQAMPVVIPPTGNNAIALLKDSSLVSVISMKELLYQAQLIYSAQFNTIPLLVVVCIWYLAMTTVASVGQYYLERHFDRGSTRTPPPRFRTRFGRNLTSILRPGARMGSASDVAAAAQAGQRSGLGS
ncbi:amino acid ABC transporter permease [Conexibacter sp. S30A1]|jgi:polar amino acid transport system permease protein|uniref:amino acid ABC transporter permease n=1 Tax=Conexibacter sp. S30A1 TaxID=2937800 RepID=UPI00200F8674|nr:amino acid ABC transporter permease [Conexibacter sp. S30A1]